MNKKADSVLKPVLSDITLNLDLYRKLYIIRRCEEYIVEHYRLDGMRTPMHMSMGSEAIAAGICHSLGSVGQVLGTYRSHAVYLARTENIEEFFAEMYGKSTSKMKGKAGSMHLASPLEGALGSSAVVGSCLSVGVGAGYANKLNKSGKIVAVFFGEGALEEGTFFESLNIACLKKIPIIFVCEDNGLAIHTPLSIRQAYKSITKIVSEFGCHVFETDTTDVEEVYHLTSKAVGAMKETERPCFMKLKYYRYLEHVGVNTDFQVGYRSKKEFEEWYKRDPIKLQKEKLVNGGVDESEITRIEQSIETRIQKSIEDAEKAPFAPEDELYRGVFS